MIPVIGLAANSGAGKTTLIGKLIEELSKRGYKVAAIKHSRHKVDLDREGKDTALMSDAGAVAVSLASRGKVAMYMEVDEEWPPEDIVAKLFPAVDLVLVEGFGKAAIPRLAIVRKGVAEEMPDAKGLIGVVTDMEIQTDLPAFSFDQVTEITDLVETYIKRKGHKRDVKLFVNEKRVFIKPFIKDFFLKTISAMVDSLKGTRGAQRIQILIDKPGGEAEEE